MEIQTKIIAVFAAIVPGIMALAEATGSVISDGGGWVGAGLLGSVLAWLFAKHLPDKDKQLKELIQSKDEQIRSVISTYQAREDKLYQIFREDLGLLRGTLEAVERALREVCQNQKRARSDDNHTDV